jgi:hypothetical protein
MSLHAARLAQLRALERRIEGAPARVQAILRERLEAARAGLPPEEAAAGIRPIAVRGLKRPQPVCEPLAALNRQRRDAAPSGEDLQSAIRFRRSWSRTRAADRVVEAASLRPAQAGPLNSHVLMLESLDLMRELSPDYLRRFIAHAETLLWLEGLAVPAAKRPRR